MSLTFISNPKFPAGQGIANDEATRLEHEIKVAEKRLKDAAPQSDAASSAFRGTFQGAGKVVSVGDWSDAALKARDARDVALEVTELRENITTGKLRLPTLTSPRFPNGEPKGPKFP